MFYKNRKTLAVYEITDASMVDNDLYEKVGEMLPKLPTEIVTEKVDEVTTDIKTEVLPVKEDAPVEEEKPAKGKPVTKKIK